MITPAYAITATERVLPRLALDFTTGTLDPRVTVTRALNTATRVNSSGFIETVNADLPRFDYDPATLAPKGLLIEETRTNLQTYSNQFDNAAWTKGAGVTVSPNAIISPDGTLNADEVSFSAGGTSQFLRSTAPIVAGTTYTYSIYAKLISGNPTFTFDQGNGTPSSDQTPTNVWQRFLFTFTCAAPNLWLDIQVNSAGSIAFFGAQVEAGAFATSYIPTTTTSLTRNADQVTMTGTNFSSWYNASEGTFVVMAQIPSTGGATRRVLSVNDGATSNSIQLALLSNGRQGYYEVLSGGVAQLSGTNGLRAVGEASNPFTTALSYKQDNYFFAFIGTTASTDTSALVPAVTQMQIGGNVGTYMNGTIEKILFYAPHFTARETQAFSK